MGQPARRGAFHCTLDSSPGCGQGGVNHGKTLEPVLTEQKRSSRKPLTGWGRGAQEGAGMEGMRGAWPTVLAVDGDPLLQAMSPLPIDS